LARRRPASLGWSEGMQVRVTILAVAIGLSAAAVGCAGAQLQEMQRQVEVQKAQIDSQAREIAEMNAHQQSVTTTMPPPGACDEAVMHKALAHGDDQYAAGQYTNALGYYQDAGTACPGNAQAELSLGRTYEKLGDRQQAAQHYQLAHDAAGANTTLAGQARKGIARVGGAP
jgi:tetratricopeptide (TPR) repeat protein